MIRAKCGTLLIHKEDSVIYIVFIYRFSQSNVLEGSKRSTGLGALLVWAAPSVLIEGIKSEEKRSKLLAEDGHQSVLSFTLTWKTFFIAPNIEQPRNPRMLRSCKPFRGSKWSFKTVYN